MVRIKPGSGRLKYLINFKSNFWLIEKKNALNKNKKIYAIGKI